MSMLIRFFVLSTWWGSSVGTAPEKETPRSCCRVVPSGKGLEKPGVPKKDSHPLGSPLILGSLRISCGRKEVSLRWHLSDEKTPVTRGHVSNSETLGTRAALWVCLAVAWQMPTGRSGPFLQTLSYTVFTSNVFQVCFSVLASQAVS